MTKPKRVRFLALSVLLLLWAAGLAPGCKKGHSHDGTDAGSHAAEGLPVRSVTVWTDKSELFMEYEPPLVGREGKFAVHLTALSSFKPVTEGELILTVKLADGTRLTSRASAPSSPGIFRAVVRPTVPGKCELSIVIRNPGLDDKIDAGPCEVSADENAARALVSKEAKGGISFTKEQQWKTEFRTTPVAEREVVPSVQANAEIRPVAGKEAKLTAPLPGRITLASPAPVVGMAVKSGQVLAVISPRLAPGVDRASLDAEVQATRAELEAARTQLARAERLFQDQAVPARQVEEARTRTEVASARVSAAKGRLEQYSSGAAAVAGARQGAFQIRSPLSGTLVASTATSGESVEEGKLLFTVIDLERVWLEARVFEPDIPRVESARTAWFTVDGYTDPFVVDEKNGRPVTVGRVIDPQNRTVPVIFELLNPDGRLRIGQFAKVHLGTGEGTRMPAIPDSAILDEAGKPVAYVQIEGETFERRPLTLGARSMGWAGVRDGLKPGERVVTRGAYEIKLSAASGAIPQHGHVH